MGLLNSKKSGFFANIQPSIAPHGNIVPTTAIAPQQLISANANVTFENAPIETTHTLGLALSKPSYPGAVSGTTAGLSRATTGYSKVLMINGYPAVTSSAKKMLNNGNTFMTPMVQPTKAKTYCYIVDSIGGGPMLKGTPDPDFQAKIQAANLPWTEEQKAAFAEKFKSCQDRRPDPAPANILGQCQYYQWRNDDFIKRHKNCDHLNPPDYYLQYGLVFCRLFSTELSQKMDAYGKGWIDCTRLNLQIDMEAFLKANPAIELDNRSFYETAFQSHQKAYLDAGFLNLSGRDTVQFLDITDFIRTLIQVNYVGQLARTQTIELMHMYLEAHKQDEYGLSILEAAKEGNYLLDTWRHSLFEEINDSI